MQGHLLDELRVEANQMIELGAIGQGRECFSEVAAGVAVEVAFTREAAPPGEKMAKEVITSLSERDVLAGQASSFSTDGAGRSRQP
jgi:hypothetical protein